MTAHEFTGWHVISKKYSDYSDCEMIKCKQKCNFKDMSFKVFLLDITKKNVSEIEQKYSFR